MGTADDTPTEEGIQAEGILREAIEVKALDMYQIITVSTRVTGVTTIIHPLDGIPHATLTGPAGRARCMLRKDPFATCITREAQNEEVQDTHGAA
mmetsp:Transcript_3712/g.9465  ORF Transcript_3712/g.9465 Transcript_3712/m.9465 type:complete len:95 (+) Transcript_3712:2823-3107(+)